MKARDKDILSVRIEPADHSLINRAARLSGRSKQAWIVETLRVAAEGNLDSHRVCRSEQAQLRENAAISAALLYHLFATRQQADRASQIVHEVRARLARHRGIEDEAT